MMATTYKAPDYDDKKYRSGVNTSFYDKAVENYKNQQEQNRATPLFNIVVSINLVSSILPISPMNGKLGAP